MPSGLYFLRINYFIAHNLKPRCVLQILHLWSKSLGLLVMCFYCTHIFWVSVYSGMDTLEPLNNGHTGGRDLVLYRVVWQPTPLIPKLKSIEGCGLQVVKSVILCRHIQNRSKMEQNGLLNGYRWVKINQLHHQLFRSLSACGDYYFLYSLQSFGTSRSIGLVYGLSISQRLLVL